MHKNKKAFTLIELLVVVLIIGILSAIALPQYQKTVELSRAAQVPPIVKELKQAADMYVLANGYVNICIGTDMDAFGIKVPTQSPDGRYEYSLCCSAGRKVCEVDVDTPSTDDGQAIDLHISRKSGDEQWYGDCQYDTSISKYSKSICDYFENSGLFTRYEED